MKNLFEKLYEAFFMLLVVIFLLGMTAFFINQINILIGK